MSHSSLCLHVVYLLYFFFLEQEAISHSEKRGRVLHNNCCQALWCRPHQVSAIPLGEHSGATEDSGDCKSVHWYADCDNQT